jgi:hypothetical protein
MKKIELFFIYFPSLFLPSLTLSAISLPKGTLTSNTNNNKLPRPFGCHEYVEWDVGV